MTHDDTPAAPNPVRPPSAEELAQLREWFRGRGREEADLLDGADWSRRLRIGVFDDFIPGCPGYAGKLLFLARAGAPDACDAFVWRGRRLAHLSSHADCGGE